jgi:TonB family protein
MNRNYSRERFTKLSALAAFAAAAAIPHGAFAMETPARSACLVKDHQAAIAQPYPADYPAIAHAEGVEGKTYVRVALTKTGNVKSSMVERSSGNKALDDSALYSARSSTYTPATVACQPVDGDYIVEVDFDI